MHLFLISTLCIPGRICVCLYLSIYSPGVNQFIMRYLVRELAGEERKQVPKSGWKASQSSEPPGWDVWGALGAFLVREAV